MRSGAVMAAALPGDQPGVPARAAIWDEELDDLAVSCSPFTARGGPMDGQEVVILRPPRQVSAVVTGPRRGRGR